MKRIERLVEIEKLWKSKTRYHYCDGDIQWYLKWEHIQWEPFTVKGQPFDLKNPSVERAIEDHSPAAEGYYFWSWGFREEASGTLEWDWALLHLLHTWYCLPEECDAPLFVNERAMAVCIPNCSWANSLALLFQHPDSVLLGMEHMEAEKAAREVPEKANVAVTFAATPGVSRFTLPKPSEVK